MNKLDLIKVYRAYFTAKAKPELVTIEEAHYISIKGKGDPAAPVFRRTQPEKLKTILREPVK